LQAANNELISFAMSCSEAQWAALVAGESWSVGVVLHHCAEGHRVATSWIRDMLEHGEVAVTPEELDAANERHARDAADVSIGETVALLRDTGPTAVEYLRGRTDDDLDHEAVFGPAGGRTFKVESFAAVMARHPLEHLRHAREAVAIMT
jgi:hypothetical protein